MSGCCDWGGADWCRGGGGCRYLGCRCTLGQVGCWSKYFAMALYAFVLWLLFFRDIIEDRVDHTIFWSQNR
jgi:hypothetical protein